MKKVVSVFAALLLASACVDKSSSDVYSGSEVGTVSEVVVGILVSAKPVKIVNDGNEVGTIGGAVMGGVLGSAIGDGAGSAIAAVGGAIVGGMVGNQVGKAVTDTNGVEYTVKKKDGSMIAITQRLGKGEVMLKTGQKVKVMMNAAGSRVLPE